MHLNKSIDFWMQALQMCSKLARAMHKAEVVVASCPNVRELRP
ncbi:hypothetical protein swp_4018 [Shewanella piezotolerans WP3]|uniref:Uncharacterized protein n=1 Tax=Shewanella piezotolerans (strain WP3 / JCM 13877) TaxID=225849 RepID=B8CSR3_SHEPW|nr:hypothetical protein swp_4018 [Shewanella piezotolerans WP3]